MKKCKMGHKGFIRILYLSIFLCLTLGVYGCGSKELSKPKDPTKEIATFVEEEEKEEVLQEEIQKQEVEEKEVQQEEVTLPSSNMKVTFLDVGQGNATLVEIDGKFMLIDGGDREYSSFVVSYLKERGVQALDYLIVSHYDADHLNGIVGALNVFPVGTIIAPDYSMDTRVYRSFKSKVEELGITPISPRVGDTFSFMGATMEVVGPANYNHKDVNDNSIVIKLTNGKNSFLFTADAEGTSEGEMLAQGVNLKADVCNVGHHGSTTSSTTEFLQAVNPTYGVISVGEGNSYGHPSQGALQRLQNQGITMFRTDEQGTIEALSDGITITWNVEPSQNWTGGGETFQTEDKAPQVAVTIPEEGGGNFILNTNTMKFHFPNCSSVETIKEHNYQEFSGTKEEVIANGYQPCKRCNP